MRRVLPKQEDAEAKALQRFSGCLFNRNEGVVMNKTRSSYRWMSFVAASFLAVSLAGCNGGGGGGGGDTSVGPPPNGGGAPAVAVPTGTSPINVTTLTPAAFAALMPVVTIGGVGISSPAQVTFSIADANNNPIIGIGYTNQTATATVPSLAHLRFSLAKLVPGANGSPSKWVNYIVTTRADQERDDRRHYGLRSHAAYHRPARDIGRQQERHLYLHLLSGHHQDQGRSGCDDGDRAQ